MLEEKSRLYEAKGPRVPTFCGRCKHYMCLSRIATSDESLVGSPLLGTDDHTTRLLSTPGHTQRYRTSFGLYYQEKSRRFQGQRRAR